MQYEQAPNDDLKARDLASLKQQKKKLLAEIQKLFGKGRKGGLQLSGASINKFDLVKEFPNGTLHDSINVSCEKQIVRLQFIKTYSVQRFPKGGTMEFHDLFPICCFPVRKDFGRSIIRTETILDKIAEIFHPCEHDFEEYRYFSWLYCCFSNHPEKLRRALNEEITELFIEHDEDVAVEFCSGYCLVKNYLPVRKTKHALHMVAFSLRLQKLIG